MTVTTRGLVLAPGTSLRVHDSFEDASCDAAAIVGAAVQEDSRAVLGVATGSTPSLLYSSLASRAASGEIDFRAVSAFALDEYVGLRADHPESYRAVLDREVRLPLGIHPLNVHVPDGSAADLAAAGRAYDAAILASGGIDLQILGIGGNGHIGFNEPGALFDTRTRPVRLEEDTRRANARFFGGILDRVPEHALTQGIGTILQAASIVLLASGRAKARAIERALLGPIDPACPASALQLHPHVTIVLDQAAASGLDGSRVE